LSLEQETINEFKHIFWSKRGYMAVPTGEKRANGKHIYKYNAISTEIQDLQWQNHFKTGTALTPSPIVNQDECCWGAIDIDNYDIKVQSKVFLVRKAKDLKLLGAESKSGGLHLYCFAKDNVPAKQMRAYLRWCRKELKLSTSTEIFPKQDVIEPDQIGNGITIPYREYKLDKYKAPCGLVAFKDEVVSITPEQFVQNAKSIMLDVRHFTAFEPTDTREEPLEDNLGEYDEGSMQDPAMQKLSAKELLQLIASEKMTLTDDSYFDDMITLYVAKSVVAMATDDEILERLYRLKDTGADDSYYQKKIERARVKLNIEDPEIARAELLKNVIYIKQKDIFFDISTNEEYDKSAINFTYARLFKKETPSQFIMKNARRIVVEDWVYDPKNYNPKERLLTIDKKLYLNSYIPGDLVPQDEDVLLWDQLLDHYFNDNHKYKEHFLDWLAYQLQHPGEKIRHALILVSTQFQVGKGSIWRAIKLMFGSHNAREIDVGQALDKSKGYLTNSQIVLIDEMQSAGKFDEKTALLNNLKRIITEEHISSRALYIDYKIVKSCTNYLLFTNHKDALSLPNNEVRYWVYISEQSRLNDKFYADYHSWLDNGGAGAILNSLLKRDISEDFKPKGVAPDTPFRQVMSKGGEHPLTKIVRQLYEEYQFPFTEKQIVIGSMELYNTLKSKGMLKNGRINDVANALESIGGRLLGQCRVSIDNKITKPTLYLIRDLDKYFGVQPQKLADELYFPIPPEDLEKGGNHF